MLPAISLNNSSSLSSAHPRRKKPNRPYLKRVASLYGAVSKAPLAALMAGGLASLACSFVAHAGPVTDWNTIATTHAAANQDPGTQTHTLAIVHIATHDALNAVVPRYEPYAYTGSAPGASVAAAVATAAHNTLVPLIPQAAAAIDAEYAAALAAIPNGPAKEAGVLTGQAAAAAILDRRRSDDLVAAATKPYQPGDPTPGVYQPTPPLNVVILAGWGELTPFAPADSGHFRSAPPLPVNGAKYARD
jgi:hypothetical protein